MHCAWLKAICRYIIPSPARTPTFLPLPSRREIPGADLRLVICRPFTQWLHHTMIGNTSLMSDFHLSSSFSFPSLQQAPSFRTKNRINAYTTVAPRRHNDDASLSDHVICHVTLNMWTWEVVPQYRCHAEVIGIVLSRDGKFRSWPHTRRLGSL